MGVNVLAIHVLAESFFIYRELQTSSYGEISGSGIQIIAIRMGAAKCLNRNSQPRLHPCGRLSGNKLYVCMQRIWNGSF